MQSSKIFSIGEQDANDLLESEDLWEDFSKDTITSSNSRDDSKENILNSSPKSSNSGSRFTAFKPSSFIKACQPTDSINGHSSKTSIRGDSISHLRPSASESKQGRISADNSADGRSYLVNLVNHGNKQSDVMVTQRRETLSTLPQQTTNFQSSFKHATSTGALNLETAKNTTINDHTRVQPFRRKVDSSPGEGELLFQSLAETTPSKGFQKFEAPTVHSTKERLGYDHHERTFVSPTSHSARGGNGFRKFAVTEDVGDCPTSSFKSSATSLATGRNVFVAAKEDRSSIGANAAARCESPSISLCSAIPDKSHLNGRNLQQLSPQRQTINYDDNKSNTGLISPNLTPLMTSQFQKKRKSLEQQTPAGTPNYATNSRLGVSSFTPHLRPSSHMSPNQIQPFQSTMSPSNGSRSGTTTPISTGRPLWNSPRSRNSAPVGSSARRTPASNTPCEQFPSPQRPLFTPRVAQLCKTPTGPMMGRQTRGSRKFPGPAGILPKLSPGQDLSSIPPLEEEKDEEAEKEVIESSQDCVLDDYNQGAWATMKVELDLDEKDPKSLLAQNNIASVLRKASMKQLQRNKVPHICVMIKLITFHVNDGVVTFRDPTGEMQGTMHRRLIEEYQSDLKPGCVLLLKQVGVLSPSIRNHYLNVTLKNVIQIFPPEHTSSQPSPSVASAKTTIGPSPKSIKVNKCSEDDAASIKVHRPGDEHQRHKQVLVKSNHSSTNGGREDVERYVSDFIQDGEGVPDHSPEQSERKRSSDEMNSARTKRVCPEPPGREFHQSESVFSGKNSWNGDRQQPKAMLPPETIADLIEGFEDELFEDF